MITWEAHACLPLSPRADFAPLDEYRAAGVNYVSVNVGMDMNPLSQVLSVIAAFRERIAAHPDRYLLASSVDDIERAAASGLLAIGFDLEGALPLQQQPAMVALYRDLGVRQIHLAYNRNNSVADGCHDVERGLTALGRRIVAAVNDAGLLMDCSHTGRRCSLDIMAASTQPVIFSHSNPLALVEHGRNVTDEQIRACAATGGVVCVSGVSMFVGLARAHGRPRRAPRGVRRGSRRRRARGNRSRHQLQPAGRRRHAAHGVRCGLLVAQGGRLQPGALAQHVSADRVVARAGHRVAVDRHDARRSRAGDGRQHGPRRAQRLALTGGILESRASGKFRNAGAAAARTRIRARPTI